MLVLDVPEGVKLAGLTESFCQFYTLVRTNNEYFPTVSFFDTPCIVLKRCSFLSIFIPKFCEQLLILDSLKIMCIEAI